MLLQTFVSAIFHRKVNMSSYKSCQRLMSHREATPFPQFYLAARAQKPERDMILARRVEKTLAARICYFNLKILYLPPFCEIEMLKLGGTVLTLRGHQG